MLTMSCLLQFSSFPHLCWLSRWFLGQYNCHQHVCLSPRGWLSVALLTASLDFVSSDSKQGYPIKYCEVRRPYRKASPAFGPSSAKFAACRLMSSTTSEERPPAKRQREDPQVGPPAPHQWTVKRPRTGSATAADIAALIGTGNVPQRSERAVTAGQGPSGKLPFIPAFLSLF